MYREISFSLEKRKLKNLAFWKADVKEESIRDNSVNSETIWT